MSASDRVFTGSVPDIYDRLLVPLIFDFYAIDLSRRVAQARPGRILETAAGTGALTRALSAALGSNTCLVATDLNGPMLEIAKARLPDSRIAWQQGDALSLPFDPGSFDAVCCQFGAMFFPDRLRAFREAHRVLGPGGRLHFNVWDEITENEFADAVTAALEEVFLEDPPRFLARTPHGHADVQTLRRELQAAGFGEIRVEAVEGTSRASSPRVPAVAYCQGTPLRTEIEARDPTMLQTATDAAARMIARRFGEGEVSGKMRAFVLSARAGAC
ncbi:class I SAM-dependent methyltransferase [Rhodoplanes roseus]|uniref:SAM-dependent methyltransferase n=1 Tax=Rhodoplanes roseus TaxID=29409 RepID=A0A327KW13_9BRAD|nr:methyltransferase domain-containing protein [Rhodoplanes roseus]RAI43070.1 SAM-dependent methyltransferase [Rhodoplanes roseus]